MKLSIVLLLISIETAAPLLAMYGPTPTRSMSLEPEIAFHRRPRPPSIGIQDKLAHRARKLGARCARSRATSQCACLPAMAGHAILAKSDKNGKFLQSGAPLPHHVSFRGANSASCEVEG